MKTLLLGKKEGLQSSEKIVILCEPGQPAFSKLGGLGTFVAECCLLIRGEAWNLAWTYPHCILPLPTLGLQNMTQIQLKSHMNIFSCSQAPANICGLYVGCVCFGLVLY